MMRMNNLRFVLAPAVLLVTLLASGVASANLWCDTAVRDLYTNSNGATHVFLEAKGEYVYVCNVSTDGNRCDTWVSMILGGVLSDDRMMFFYPAEYATCADIPDYGGNPGYVMIR